MKNNGSLLPLISKILFIVFLTASSIFSQTTYYISSSEGNDSNNGTSESTPWASLTKLDNSWSSIVGGVTIKFKRGDTWNPSSNPNGNTGLITIPEGKTGSRGNPIVFDAYGTGADPIISADNIFAGGGYIDGLRTKHFGWFEFRNIYFDCSIKLLAQYSSHNSIGLNHITFYGCTFEQSPVMTIGVTGQSTYAYNPYPSTVNSSSQVPVLNDDLFPKIRSMRIEHCTFIECTSNGGALNFAPYDSCYIGYNTFYDSGEEAIDLAGGYDHVIEYNKIYKAGYNGIKLHSQIYPFERAIVRGNVIVGNGMISQYGVSGAGLGLENITDCQVYNNTVYGWAYALWVGNVDREPPTGYYGNFEGNTIVNNIFIGQVIVRGTWENKYFSAPPAFPGADVLMPFTNQTGYIGVGSPENGRYGNGMFELNTFSNNTYYRDHDMFIRFGSNVSNDYYFDIPLSEAGLNSYWYPAASDNDVFGLPTFTNPHSSGAIYTDLGSLDPYNPGEYELDASSTAEINTGVYVEGYTQDLDGNPIVGIPDRGAYEFNGADITAPRVTSASLINETTLLVSFSEPLNVSTANNSNNYSISNGITVNIAAISGYQVTLTTSAHPSGDFTVTVNNVQDLAGNTIGSNNTASYSYNSDNVSPELVSAQIINATRIELLFSEALNQTNAESANNYSIDNGITVSAAILSNLSKVTLTTSEHSNGTYNIVVSNVTDIANNVIASNNTASYVYDVDSDKPELISVEVLSPNSVEIVFSEKVQELSAETITNYSISDGISIISATRSSSENKVILTTSEHTGGTYTLTVNNILDLAGNMIQTNSTRQYNVDGDIVPPELSSASLIDESTIEVYFSEAVNQNDAETLANYSINNDVIVNSALLTNSTKVTLTTTAHSVGSYIITVENVRDIAGNLIDSNNTAAYSIAPETNTPILLYAFAPANNMVEVAFSKEVTQTSAENTNNYTISDEINVLTASIKSSGTEVTLIVDELTPEFEYTLLVSNVEDLVGNSINADSNSTLFCYMNSDGPIALYDFTQGPNNNLVYDISCNGAPLNLTISNPAAITWLEGGGMSVNSSVIISSDIASKLNNNCKQTNALTIEAWIKPANITQNGPARILSLSTDISNRNFTLGQGEGTNGSYGYDIRLRTTATSNNGIPSVTATSPAVTTNLTHVVYTKNSEGETKIYINGVESLSTTLGGNLSNWDNSFKLILANEMTGDRPWLGEFHKVAIYDRALDSEEVNTTFTEYNSTMLMNLRIFLEGPYSSGNMSTDLLDNQIIPLDQPYSVEPWNYEGYERAAEIPDDIVDWILLEVRTDDTTVVARRAAFLRKDGKVVDLNGISNVWFKGLALDEYFISVIHRNHLSIISSEKVTLDKHSQLLDLTRSENVFGEESTADLGNGVYGMYAGDTNCSSIITYSDAMGIVQKNTKSGYNIADVNLSGIVTYADVTHVVNNNTKSVSFKLNK